MSAFGALVRKDVLLYLTNRRALVLALIAPVAIGAFVGTVMGAGPVKAVAVPVAMVDLDHSDLSRRIVGEMSKDAGLVVQQLPQPQAIDLVRRGKLRAAAILPAGFGASASDALFRPEVPKPRIELHFDPSQGASLQLIKGLLTQYVMQAVSASAFGADNHTLTRQRDAVMNDQKLDPTLRTSLLNMFRDVQEVQRQRPTASEPNASRQGLSIPYVTQDIEVSSGEARYNAYAHSFASMAVQFILLMGVELGVGLLLMRRMGLWQRLRAAPLSRTTLLGSRIAAGALIAMILMAGIFAAAMLLFGVRIEGSIPGFIGIAAAFAILTSCLGLLIAAIGRTPEATRGIAIVLTLMLVMLGGAWVPTFIFPSWLQSATQFVPTRWAIDGFDAMTWRAQSFRAVLLPMAQMLGLSAVLAVVAVRLFRWEE